MSKKQHGPEVCAVHLASEELALYVIDALDPMRKEDVESHVFTCEACAEALAREASVEAAFDQVAWLAQERVARAQVAQLPRLRERARRDDDRFGGGACAADSSGAARSGDPVGGGARERWCRGLGGAGGRAASAVRSPRRPRWCWRSRRRRRAPSPRASHSVHPVCMTQRAT